MFTAALLIMAPKWKPKCPSTDEWTSKMWYIHIMEYYSSIKRNEVLTHATTWMNLETIMLSLKKKKASHKRLHTVGFRLHEMPSINKQISKQIQIDRKSVGSCIGLEDGG